MTTLIVDGDNLLTIGFFGVKNQFYKGRHIGGIYHFINTLRRLFDEYNLDKICVFWDGEESSAQRRAIYPYYKIGVHGRFKSEEEKSNYNYQKNRIQKYIEELYVRQGEYPYCESDDCIAYYVQNSPDEDKIIYSTDRDLLQLLNDRTTLYNHSHNRIYKSGDIIEYEHQEMLVENVKIVKIICGDPSDEISGIKGLGIKKFIGLCPEIKTTPLTVEYVRQKGNLILEQDKRNWAIQNLLTGVTKHGVMGEEFFEINSKIVDLTYPFLDNVAKSQIDDLINENLDTEGRSYKNVMKMMIEDGIFNLLPTKDDAWVNFLNPFLRLTRKEKNKIIFKLKK